MAFVSTVAFKSVFGSTRVVCLSMVADSGSGDTAGQGTGLGAVFAGHITPVSMTTTGAHVKVNVLTAGTAAVGHCAVSNVTSGDVFYLTLYGRS